MPSEPSGESQAGLGQRPAIEGTSNMLFPNFETFRVTLGGVEINGVRGGSGPPVLLLHGFPQTHAMWHKIAPDLARDFTVICPDLRGYGDSDKPPTTADHAPYSKRAMAADQIALMQHFGFERFALVGHDRGGRVAHRLTLDHPDRVERLAVLDIVPTHTLFHTVTQAFATVYYHWFFLIQPAPLPERLIGNDPDFMLETWMGGLSGGGEAFDPEAMEEYRRCFRDAATIHGACEDYRAAATIDLDHDRRDLGERVTCPLLVLWGARGKMDALYDVLDTWRDKALRVEGKALDGGHFLAEECPEETLHELRRFLLTV